jgi:hypothetical protein
MKKMLVLLILAMVPLTVFADDSLKLSITTIGAGKGAFVSGLNVGASWTKSNASLSVLVSQELQQAIYLWNLPANISAGMSGGAYNNMLWFGPYVSIAPTKSVSLYYWTGWSMGEPERPAINPKHFFDCAGGSWALTKFLTLNFCWLSVYGDPVSLPGFAVTFPVNSKFKVLFGVDYKIQTHESLYRVSISYFPEK